MAGEWHETGLRICVSVHFGRLPEALESLPDRCLVEVRLDRVSPDEPGWSETLRRVPRPVIATCRPGFLAQEDCDRVIRGAIAVGVLAVDLDLRSPEGTWKSIRQWTRDRGTRLIASYHAWHGTPPLEDLLARVEECRATGADLVKIACMARTREDGLRLLRLYDRVSVPLVAFCMGEAGRFTRFEALRRGAPFLYASAGPGWETAPGQPTVYEALRVLEGPGAGIA